MTVRGGAGGWTRIRSLVRFDFEAARRALHERDGLRREEEKTRRSQALLKAGEVASFLRTRYGVAEVLLYGSLAWEKHFTAHSDIDLLIEGFPKDGDYWRMLTEASDITAPFTPSVVLAEDASESLLRRVREEGVKLP